MAEKKVSVRLVAEGRHRVRAELEGVGEAGARGFVRLSREMELANTRLAAFARRAGLALGAAAAAATASLGLIVRSTADSAAQIRQFAQVANATPEALQRWSAGARTVGIEQEKLADILKDVNDRVGDFLQTGGGPMADFFENVAPRVGVTADQFARLSGPEALQLYVDTLEHAGLSQQEMTFYLEAMASDTTRLLPLLRNGGAEMARLGDQASDLSAVLDSDALEALRRTQLTLGTVFLDFVAEGRPRPCKQKPNNRARKLQGHKPTPIRVNRMGEVLRKMFTLAMEWEWRTDNPAQGFHRRIEHARERFLSPEELTRLAAVLDAAEDQRAAAIIRMCMLTGARVGEVRTARFEQFNLDYAIWSKPASTTKQRKIHRVPISQDVAAIVRLRQQAVPGGNPWLFPGDTVGQPVREIRRFWTKAQKEAGLADVRIHDLRHTFASLLVSGGASLEMIGKLLGHSQMQTTQRYAHLMDSPLRAGVDTVASLLHPRPRLVHDAAQEETDLPKSA